MSDVAVPREQVETLLASFKILDYSALDPETFAAASQIPAASVIASFDRAECQGFIEHVRGSMYVLTTEGESALDEILSRRPPEAVSD